MLKVFATTGFFAQDKMGGVYARLWNVPILHRVILSHIETFCSLSPLISPVFITLYNLYHLYFDLKETVAIM